MPHRPALLVPFPALRDSCGDYLVRRHAVALVLALYPHADVRSGPDAAVTALVRGDPAPSLVYFGTHAAAVEDAPLDSFVALARSFLASGPTTLVLTLCEVGSPVSN